MPNSVKQLKLAAGYLGVNRLLKFCSFTWMFPCFRHNNIKCCNKNEEPERLLEDEGNGEFDSEQLVEPMLPLKCIYILNFACKCKQPLFLKVNEKDF